MKADPFNYFYASGGSFPGDDKGLEDEPGGDDEDEDEEDDED
ncbi:MAG TPA: hypothetical protein VMD91_13120 [Candidatus Sulfotelmatobacter sp.]|nr:hypothetical protein [Candidatus Sulfotelmatobacter sp.]